MLDVYPHREATAETLYKNNKTVTVNGCARFAEIEVILWKAKCDWTDKWDHITVHFSMSADAIHVHDTVIMKVKKDATRAGMYRKLTVDWAALVEWLLSTFPTGGQVDAMPYWVMDTFEVVIDGVSNSPE